MEQKMKATDKLSWLEKISFSGGEMGTNLLFTVMSAYLLVYYTNYAHLHEHNWYSKPADMHS